MSIRPVDFNGMIQNTHEISAASRNEDSKPIVQQANVSIEVDKQTEQRSRQVNQSQDKDEQYRYDREGNGRGYQGNKGGKKKKEQEAVLGTSKDGSVKNKLSTSSFDIKI